METIVDQGDTYRCMHNIKYIFGITWIFYDRMTRCKMNKKIKKVIIEGNIMCLCKWHRTQKTTMLNYVSPVLIFSSKSVISVLVIIFLYDKRRKKHWTTELWHKLWQFQYAIMIETPKTQLLKVILQLRGNNWYRTLYVYLVTDNAYIIAKCT